jgi:glycosyltransferase involved in cell wall biosynthesis
MTTRTPLVGIGLPVYNGEPHLRATLESLVNQTCRDFELIICDNASTDGTESICREYAQRDGRVHYHRSQVNVGAARNYRRTFELSSSTYFKWANADDLVAPTLLERCLEALHQHPEAILAYPKTRLIDASGKTIDDYQDNMHLMMAEPRRRFEAAVERLGLCNIIYGLMRRDVLGQTRLMGSYIGSDRVLVAELALYGQFYEVPEVLFSRRLHPQAFSSQKDVTRRLRFYNPERTDGIALARWRSLGEYGRAVHHSPLALAEKVELALYLARTAVWHRRELTAEIWTAVKKMARTRTPRAASF